MTINNKGDKTVHIRTTGNDKNQFTVVLTYSADGSKYPLICIFKGKQLPHDGSEDDMVYEEIDKLITEFEDKNLDELNNNTKIVDN
ncbi:unnamed protein product [Rhizophagus irregularis]|nr:unnamed protein product [Rhizophagus irregularis]